MKIEIEMDYEIVSKIVRRELRDILETAPERLWDEPEYVESLQQAAEVLWTWYSCPGDEIPTHKVAEELRH